VRDEATGAGLAIDLLERYGDVAGDRWPVNSLAESVTSCLGCPYIG
jgi:hypothetical protein